MYHIKFTFNLQTAEIDFFYKPKNNCHNIYDFMQKTGLNKGQRGIGCSRLRVQGEVKIYHKEAIA